MALKTSTTIDRFGAALKAALEAREAIRAGVAVTEGVPPPGTFASREWVMIGDVTFEQEVRGMHPVTRPRRERYQQTVMISVVREGQETAELATARAFELFVELEDTIRDNPILDGYFAGDGQIISVQMGRGTLTKRATDTTRESTLEVELDVDARI